MNQWKLTVGGVVFAWAPSPAAARLTARRMGFAGAELVHRDGRRAEVSPVTPDDVEAVRVRLAASPPIPALPTEAIAERGRARASAVAMRKSGHVLGQYNLTDETARAIREDRAAGLSTREVAAKYRCSTDLASKVCRGELRRTAGGPLTARRTSWWAA